MSTHFRKRTCSQVCYLGKGVGWVVEWGGAAFYWLLVGSLLPHLKQFQESGTSFYLIGLDKRGVSGKRFSDFSSKTCCGYSLKAPHRGASNEYPHYVFIDK